MRKFVSLIFLLNSILILGQEEVIIHLDKENLKTSDIYIVVDENPDLICDYEGTYQTKVKTFISQHLLWPDSEIDCEGTVYIQFIVEPDSTISNINIVRGLDSCKGFNEEAIRVVKLMDKWKPGKKDGESVRVQLTVPVKFKIE